MKKLLFFVLVFLEISNMTVAFENTSKKHVIW